MRWQDKVILSKELTFSHCEAAADFLSCLVNCQLFQINMKWRWSESEHPSLQHLITFVIRKIVLGVTSLRSPQDIWIMKSQKCLPCFQLGLPSVSVTATVLLLDRFVKTFCPVGLSHRALQKKRKWDFIVTTDFYCSTTPNTWNGAGKVSHTFWVELCGCG